MGFTSGQQTTLSILIAGKNSMSADIISHVDGIVTVKITGLFTYSEQLALQKATINLVSEENKLSVLTLYEDFEGWSHDEGWGDVSFQEKSDPLINKMAVVGEEKWRDLILMSLGDGFRGFPIAYFHPDELDNARIWLLVE
jgi:hypothetical protein